MNFPNNEQLSLLATEHPTPFFVYSRQALRRRAAELLALDLPYGLTVRYAVKANNHPEVVAEFLRAGLSFDASSSFEAEELLNLGVDGSLISLSSQQPAHNLPGLLAAGVQYVATSLHQLQLFLDAPERPSAVGLRVNPGIGAGHNNRTTTGGANSGFGLWNVYVPEALAMAAERGVKITRLHVHIGSGADPAVWEKTIQAALEIAEIMPDVTSLDIGGGFKVKRWSDEHETDMVAVASVFRRQLEQFALRTGRQLHLEIEPGTWLVAHAGVLVAEIVDKVDTGPDGHEFLRLNTGMNDILRPGMYGAQHRLTVLNDSSETSEYVVIGHNCETGDILTPAGGDPERLEPRELNTAGIGDKIAIHDTGAYCRSMAAKGYNSFPSAGEIVID